MKKLFVMFQFLVFAYSLTIAQSTMSVDLQKNSSITINGTTNVLSFKLTQNGEKLTKRNFIINATLNQNRILLSQNEHAIVVRDFNSSNKMALRDFLKLVNADNYPAFHVKLNYFDLDSKTNNKELYRANVSLDLTITGKTKQYNILVESNHEGDLYRLNGIKKINIRDFGLVPPVEMMGLIRVNEWIEINFNIICKISAYKTSPELNASNIVKASSVY